MHTVNPSDLELDIAPLLYATRNFNLWSPIRKNASFATISPCLNHPLLVAPPMHGNRLNTCPGFPETALLYACFPAVIMNDAPFHSPKCPNFRQRNYIVTQIVCLKHRQMSGPHPNLKNQIPGMGKELCRRVHF